MNDRQRLFSRQASGVEGRSCGSRGSRCRRCRKRTSIILIWPTARRPRPSAGIERAHDRPLAEADRQDRRGAAAHRRRHLRLLRGDRRAHRPQTPGSPPHRDAVGGSAGAPRKTRKSLSRRVGGILPIIASQRVGANARPWAVIASHRVGAKRRPMTGSAKQSISPRKERMDCFVASLLAMVDP